MNAVSLAQTALVEPERLQTHIDAPSWLDRELRKVFGISKSDNLRDRSGFRA